MARFRPAPAAVERLQRAAEADVVPDRPQECFGARAASDQRARAARDRRGTRRAARCARRLRRRGAPTSTSAAAPEALQDLAPHRAARAPGGHREIRRRRARRSDAPSASRTYDERRARARAFEHVAPDRRVRRDTRPPRRATARRGAAARTRVSTAMSLGCAPRARHSTICATAAAANSSGAPTRWCDR